MPCTQSHLLSLVQLYLLRQLLGILRLDRIGRGRGLRGYLSLPQAIPQISAGGEGSLVGRHGLENNVLVPPEASNGIEKESIEMSKGFRGEKASRKKKKGKSQSASSKTERTAAQFVMTGRVWETQNTITSTATMLAPSTRKREKRRNNPEGQNPAQERETKWRGQRRCFWWILLLASDIPRIRQLPKPPWLSSRNIGHLAMGHASCSAACVATRY